MEQHPVPQPITSYEFRLVGDMTLKQFLKLAAGVILALIVYGINPPSFIKWFLIFLFVATGVGMAFFPFEGRPIDVWIIAFFKRIYSPTQYIWRRGNKAGISTPTNQLIAPKAEQPVPVVQPTKPNIPNSPQHPQPPLPPTKPRRDGAEWGLPPTKPEAEWGLPPTKPEAEWGQSPPKPLTPPYKEEEIFRNLNKNKVDAKFTPEIAIPATPSIPNLLVGYVRTKEDKLVEGAILEIRDSAGNPTRALKTNKLGQFLIATPLANGDYEIETEKDGIEFDIIKISLKGEIIPPIEIISK